MPRSADPGHGRVGEISHLDGRGFSFREPNGHDIAILTRPPGAST